MALQFLELTPATISTCVYELKEHLRSVGWTVPASSDGTTYNPSGDQISSGAAWNNNLAWMRLRSPDGSIEFCVQRASGNNNCRIKLGRQPFTSGAPNATTMPATADASQEVYVLGGSGSFSSFVGGTDGNVRLKGAADDAAPYGFWFAGIPSGGGSPTTAWVLDPLVDGEESDAFPWVVYCASANHFVGTNMSSATAPAVVTFDLDGAASYVVPALRLATNDGVAAPGGLPADPITGEHSSFEIAFARYTASAPSFWKGFSSLMRWAGVSSTTADTQSVDATRDHIVMRDVLLPWNGSTPTV